MNYIEKLVYDLVKKRPVLKRHVRDTYQFVCDSLPVQRFCSPYEITSREGFYFGFHDKSPWSKDDSKILAHECFPLLRMPQAKDQIRIGYFEDGSLNFSPIGTTKAWNWHQGSMLQWVGGTEEILFNDYNEKTKMHVARIVDLKGKETAEISAPIAALSPDGKYGVTYSFARLRGCPHGYAYANGEDLNANILCPEMEFLSIVELSSGRIERLFSLAEISSTDPHISMNGSFHYFSHVQIDPSGTRLKFFHRWTDTSNLLHTRMFTCNLDGSALFLIPTGGMVSHVSWRNSEQLLAYARSPSLEDGYFLYQDKSNVFESIGSESFNSDGHPSCSKDEQWFVTDSYPDRFRVSYLSLCNIATGTRFDLAKLHSPRRFFGKDIADHLQCDLHPRWSRDNTQLCFDSVNSGKRSLCTINIGDLNRVEIRKIS